CISFSPLAQGLLTDRYLGGIPEGSRASKAYSFLQPDKITDERMAQVRQLNEIAKARGQSLAQMALAWVLRHPGMTSVLIGASKVEQLDDNVASLKNLAFSGDELAAIDRIAGA
ncbi:MAG TPA: aldo/keto reductase, partial [Aggregatilineales bacterium]|nr:aldo/keto reductase [Aggregatilineales bacterium]